MKKNKRKRKVLPIVLTLMILVLAGFASYNVFQVRHVLVEGNEEYSADYIVTLADIPDETLMIRVDENKLEENIGGNPFLSLENVDYKLPDTVVLTVLERKPAAVLTYAGNVLLLDREMNVLEMDASAESANYPELQGIAVEALNLGKQLQTADAFKLSVATSILDELKTQDALGMVGVIDLTDINNIRLKTKGGPGVLFGQSDNPAGKIGWMVKLLPSLIQEGSTQGILDVTAGTFATYRRDGAQDNTNTDTQEPEEQNGEEDTA